MISIGSLTIYEIGVIIFFILFVFVSAQTFFRHRREEHEELLRFREQQRLEVIAMEERKEFVKLHLNSQRLTHEGGAPSRRPSLNLDLGASNHGADDSEDEDSSQSQDNIFTRTLCSAGKSFRELLGSSSVSKRECSICLADFKPKETVSWAKSKECSHVFHQDCIIQWLEKHNECPLCRIDIIKEVDCEDPVSVSNENSDNGNDDNGEQIEASARDSPNASEMTRDNDDHVEQIEASAHDASEAGQMTPDCEDPDSVSNDNAHDDASQMTPDCQDPDCQDPVSVSNYSDDSNDDDDGEQIEASARSDESQTTLTVSNDSGNDDDDGAQVEASTRDADASQMSPDCEDLRKCIDR